MESPSSLLRAEAPKAVNKADTNKGGEETFKKVHAGKDFQTTMSEIFGLGDVAVQELWKVEDVVTAK